MADDLVRKFLIMGHSATDAQLPALKQEFRTGYHNLDGGQMSHFNSLTKRGGVNSMYDRMVREGLVPDGKIEYGTSYGGGSLSSKSIKRKSTKRKSIKRKSIKRKSIKRKSIKRKSTKKKLSKRRR